MSYEAWLAIGIVLYIVGAVWARRRGRHSVMGALLFGKRERKGTMPREVMIVNRDGRRFVGMLTSELYVEVRDPLIPEDAGPEMTVRLDALLDSAHGLPIPGTGYQLRAYPGVDVEEVHAD